MAMDAAGLLHEALELPAPVRAGLAVELLDSLDLSDAADGDIDAAWGAEITERLRAYDTGDAAGRAWSSVRDRISESLT